MKKLIEWAEAEVARGRKLMLFSTIITFLMVTVAVMVLVAMGKEMGGFLGYYYTFATVAGVAIGFYTGTTAKSANLKEGTLENQ